MKIIKAVGLALLGLIILSVVGVSCFTGYQVAEGLIYQNAKKDTQAASVHQLEAWAYDLDGFLDKYTVYDFETEAEDGNKVPFVIIGENQLIHENTVILVHGLGGDRVSVFPHAEVYLEKGFNVLAIDQRGSGISESDWVTFGYYEQLDVKAVVDYIRKDSPNTSIYVHGFSMGGATTGLYSSSEHAEENIQGIIMDSSFKSMEDMFTMVWDQMETGMPSDYAIATGDVFLKLRYGFGFKDADVKTSLSNSKVPTLLIQSQRDDLVPMAVAEEMFEAISHDQKKMWVVDSKHIEGYIDFPIEYSQVVLEFTETYRQ